MASEVMERRSTRSSVPVAEHVPAAPAPEPPVELPRQTGSTKRSSRHQAAARAAPPPAAPVAPPPVQAPQQPEAEPAQLAALRDQCEELKKAVMQLKQLQSLETKPAKRREDGNESRERPSKRHKTDRGDRSDRRSSKTKHQDPPPPAVNAKHLAKQEAPQETKQEAKQAVSTGSSSSAAPASVCAAGTCAVLTQDQKNALQKKIDCLDDSQLDRVLEFLEVGGDLDTSGGQELQLDLDALRPERQRALVEFVDSELRLAAQCPPTAAALTTAQVPPGQADVVSAAANGAVSVVASTAASAAAGTLTSPACATPLAVATPLTNRLLSPEPVAFSAKQQRVWEDFSVREVQRQSHLRDVREAASVSGSTPAITSPAGGEGRAAGSTVDGERKRPLPGGNLRERPTAKTVPPSAAPAEKVPWVAPAVEGPQGAAPVGDSMLSMSSEVLDMVDFGWM